MVFAEYAPPPPPPPLYPPFVPSLGPPFPPLPKHSTTRLFAPAGSPVQGELFEGVKVAFPTSGYLLPFTVLRAEFELKLRRINIALSID